MRRAGLIILVGIALSGMALAWLYRDTIAHGKEVLLSLISVARQMPIAAAIAFFLADVAVTALSIPVEIVFALVAGAIFGLLEGIVLVSFASALGATLACLAVRYFLRDTVRRHFKTQLEMVDRGIGKDGSYYLLSLRLLPIFPFTLVNVLMGVTAFPIRRFYLFSQLGMLPVVALYVNAGTQFARIGSLSDVLSLQTLVSLALLGIFPLAAKRLVALWQAARHN
jgi:uncharacterized membrane protein YdjX (TVP38/TMEM64 family)